MTETPRGIRNNNPGNIRHSAVKWVGQAVEQPDPDFVTFSAPEYGIRAICRILLTYQNIDQCKTIRQLIDRWAPPEENDTQAYIDAVSTSCGIGPDEPANVQLASVMTSLVWAIIHQENGEQPYPSLLIQKALSLAGIGPTPPPTPASSTSSLSSSPAPSLPAQGQPAAA